MEVITELPLTQRPLQMAWNRAMPCELAYALEDGSVHLLDVAPCLRKGRGSLSPPAVATVYPLRCCNCDEALVQAHSKLTVIDSEGLRVLLGLCCNIS